MRAGRDHGAAEEFFDSLNEPVATLARELRGIVIKAVPEVRESIRWGMPVYRKDGLICAIRPGKQYVALQFYASGTSLDDPYRLLEGAGKKMRHVKIRVTADIRERLFTTWLRVAAGLS